MKKIYYLIIAVAAIYAASPAKADVTLTGPASVTFRSGYAQFEGGDVLKGTPQNVTAICKDGYIFKKVIVNGNVVYNYDTAKRASDSYSWWSDEHDEKITSMDVSTVKLSDVQTEKITISSPVDLWFLTMNLTFSNTYGEQATQGETEVYYIPEKDKLEISYSWYQEFYSITHNGEPVNLWPEHPDTDILVNLTDGDNIAVVAPVPDKMCHVTISSPNGETEFIKHAYYATLDNAHGLRIRHEVENPLSFDVPAGTSIEWDWNYDEFDEPELILLNGHTINLNVKHYNELVIPADRDNVTLSFPARRWKEYVIPVDVDDASRLMYIANNMIDKEKRQPLHDGLQTIDMLESQGLYFCPKGNGEIISIKVGDKELTPSDDPYYWAVDYDVIQSYLNGTENGVLHITTAERTRDLPVSIYVKDCNGTAKMWADGYIEPYYFTIADGVNTLKMSKDDLNYLHVSFNQDASLPTGDVLSTLGVTYQSRNHYRLDNNYENDFAVIKIYGTENPPFHNITVESDFDDDQYELMSDYGQSLYGTEHQLAEGSLFHVNMLGDEGSEVYVNGKKLDSATPMNHVFTVTEPATVQIKKITTGIEGVTADDDTVPVYYNLQGVRVNNPGHGIFIEVRNGEASCVKL